MVASCVFVKNNGLRLEVATPGQWALNLRVPYLLRSKADNLRHAVHISLGIVVNKGIAACNVSSNLLVIRS
jgi:hypothetical protein